MTVLSSRPWLADQDSGFKIEELDVSELKLISAFLWCTRLGQGISPYRDAAFTLMTKIEEVLGDDFIENAAIDVDLQVCVMDYQGNQIDRHSNANIEFEV